MLDRWWRIACTGLAFAALGLGGVALAVTVFPVIAIVSVDAGQRTRRTQRIIFLSFRFYVRVLRSLGILALDVVGADVLASCRGRLIIANHPTLLDVVLLMGLNPAVQCIVKHQLWRNPFLGGVVRSAGYIRNDLVAEDLLAACAAALAGGGNLIIFPEGTRTTPGLAPAFQRGFANIAIMVAADIQLVTITCEPITLTKGAPWYRIPLRRPTFRVVVGETVAASEYQAFPSRALGTRQLVRRLNAYYAGTLGGGTIETARTRECSDPAR